MNETTIKRVNQKCREHANSDFKLCVILTYTFTILDDCSRMTIYY